ncbi:hypothetical protein BGX24_009339 [Mortierella sp. AD032]|nr:hypothetical protein BGX24_009339 [Mortierella sp. AD032]
MLSESLYASSVCSEETTGRNHFQRPDLPTETEASAKADRDNEIMKVKEDEVYSPQPHVPTETEASDKVDNENEGDTNAQDSLEKRERERRPLNMAKL